MKKFLAVLACAALLLSMSGCSVVGEQESEKRVLAIGLAADPGGVDPQAAAQTDEYRVLDNIYSRLYTRDDAGNLIGDLATSLDQVNDTTWVVTLREDATFHNGDAVTAADVAYSLTRAATDHSLESYSVWQALSSAQARGDKQVMIRTTEPYPAMKALLASPGGEILPAKLVKEQGEEAFFKKPVGSGPYKFDSYDRGEKLVLTPYKDYYGELGGKWDQLVFFTIPSDTERVDALLTGYVDLITDVPAAEMSRIEEADGYHVKKGDTTESYVLEVPAELASLSQAVDNALDDRYLAEEALGGLAEVSETLLCVACDGQAAGLYGKYQYDPELATGLLLTRYPAAETENLGENETAQDGQATGNETTLDAQTTGNETAQDAQISGNETALDAQASGSENTNETQTPGNGTGNGTQADNGTAQAGIPTNTNQQLHLTPETGVTPAVQGPALTVSASNGQWEGDAALALSIAQQLTNVGFDVTLCLYQPNVYVARYHAGLLKGLVLTKQTDRLLDGADVLAGQVDGTQLQEAKAALAAAAETETTTETAGENATAQAQPDLTGMTAAQLLAAVQVNMDLVSRQTQLTQLQTVLAQTNATPCVLHRRAAYGVRENLSFTPRTDGTLCLNEMLRL